MEIVQPRHSIRWFLIVSSMAVGCTNDSPPAHQQRGAFTLKKVQTKLLVQPVNLSAAGEQAPNGRELLEVSAEIAWPLGERSPTTAILGIVQSRPNGKPLTWDSRSASIQQTGDGIYRFSAKVFRPEKPGEFRIRVSHGGRPIIDEPIEVPESRLALTRP